jgi:hypothetical protein
MQKPGGRDYPDDYDHDSDTDDVPKQPAPNRRRDHQLRTSYYWLSAYLGLLESLEFHRHYFVLKTLLNRIIKEVLNLAVTDCNCFARRQMVFLD